MLFTSIYIALNMARVRDPAVELRPVNMSLCPHIKRSYAHYYRSAQVF